MAPEYLASGREVPEEFREADASEISVGQAWCKCSSLSLRLFPELKEAAAVVDTMEFEVPVRDQISVRCSSRPSLYSTGPRTRTGNVEEDEPAHARLLGRLPEMMRVTLHRSFDEGLPQRLHHPRHERRSIAH